VNFPAARLRPYRATVMMSATGYIGDSPLFLIDYALRFLRVAVLLSIWRVILAHSGPVSGMSLTAVLTYTLIAEVFAEQFDGRTDLAEAFWNGSITTRFLQPMGLFAHYTSVTVGRWVINMTLFSVPLLIAAPFLGVDPRPTSAVTGCLFVVSLALAVGVGLAIEFISFAALVAALDVSPWIISQVRGAIGTLLSGALLPLPLLPWGIGHVFAWLPFAAMASAPLQIFIGVGSPARLLAVQAFWCAVLWPAAGWLWKVNREKLVSFGG
jgi:ABC-2 type transport system permease protein